jgi:hypothetical protein
VRLSRPFLFFAFCGTVGCALNLAGTFAGGDAGTIDATGPGGTGDTYDSRRLPDVTDPADAATSSNSDVEAAPSTGCASGRYLLCDDFEESSIDVTKWTAQGINVRGTASIDQTHACSGTHALHFVATTGIHYAQLYSVLLEHSGASLPDDVFARVFVSFDAVPAADPDFLMLEDVAGQGVQEESQGGVLGGQSYNFFPKDLLWGDGIHGKIAPSTCACVELEVDRTSSVVRTWLDGGLLAQTTFPAASIPALTRVRVGLSFYSRNSVLALYDTDQMWLDDVAVNDKRIGCNP